MAQNKQKQMSEPVKSIPSGKRPTGKFATSNKLSGMSIIFAFISILIILTYLFGIMVVAAVNQDRVEEAISVYIKLMHFIFFGCCVVYTVLGIINCVVYGLIRKDMYELSAVPMYLWISGMSVNLVFNIMGVIFNFTTIWYLGIVFIIFASAGTIPFIIGCFRALSIIKKHVLNH